MQTAYSRPSSVPLLSPRHKKDYTWQGGILKPRDQQEKPSGKVNAIQIMLGPSRTSRPTMLPGQPLFLFPARDQSRKRGCIWPAVHNTQYHPTLELILCYHLHTGESCQLALWELSGRQMFGTDVHSVCRLCELTANVISRWNGTFPFTVCEHLLCRYHMVAGLQSCLVQTCGPGRGPPQVRRQIHWQGSGRRGKERAWCSLDWLPSCYQILH